MTHRARAVCWRGRCATLARVKGGSLFVSMAQRWGRSHSAACIGNVFGAQQIFGPQTFRVMDISYQQTLSDGRVELRLGHFATARLDQGHISRR